LWDGEAYTRVLAIDCRPVLIRVIQSRGLRSPRLQIKAVAERLRPDEVAEGIVGGRHGQIIKRLIDELEEKAGVGTAFVQLSGGDGENVMGDPSRNRAAVLASGLIDSISQIRPKIDEYAIIGDCRSAALISKGGSVDWLCLPRFDSPSIFAALLDPVRGGRFTIRPRQPFYATRHYIGQTNVLETNFTTPTGVLSLTDLMPVATESEKARELFPDHEILRKLDCREGKVEIEVAFEPRPDYARAMPRFLESSTLGYFYEYREQILALRSDLALNISADLSTIAGRGLLRAGETRYLSMVFSHGYPAVMAELGVAADARIMRSIVWWETWAGQCEYDGPYRPEIMRSALTLKLLTYAPSGAIVAAPTTSLPEQLGGVRNWDYRYCWLRDASLTLQALLDLGFTVEGEAFLSWILHTTRLTWPTLNILYNVYGEAHLPEQELHHLAGYAESQPVRIGNDAAKQLQLDTYGEVIDAAFQYVIRGGRLDRATGRMLVGLGKTVCRRWTEPDEGIWEPRGGRQHHTHSRVMCWVALDRLMKLHEMRQLGAPLAVFAKERQAIQTEIETRGYNDRLQSYVSVLDSGEVDASLLLLGLNGYADPKGTRMRNTYRFVSEQLGVNDLLYRYLSDDGLPPGEGAFGICSFWAVEYLVRRGDLEGATRNFTQVMSFANDVGLFAEEMDPETGSALGNFPQAFTHVGLISAALSLTDHAPGRGRSGTTGGSL
jgi:GH15 family glucan-1,4-alpha-glucosidase